MLFRAGNDIEFRRNLIFDAFGFCVGNAGKLIELFGESGGCDDSDLKLANLIPFFKCFVMLVTMIINNSS